MSLFPKKLFFLLIPFMDKLGWNDGQSSAFAEAVVQ